MISRIHGSLNRHIESTRAPRVSFLTRLLHLCECDNRCLLCVTLASSAVENAILSKHASLTRYTYDKYMRAHVAHELGERRTHDIIRPRICRSIPDSRTPMRLGNT